MKYRYSLHLLVLIKISFAFITLVMVMEYCRFQFNVSYARNSYFIRPMCFILLITIIYKINNRSGLHTVINGLGKFLFDSKCSIISTTSYFKILSEKSNRKFIPLSKIYVVCLMYRTIIWCFLRVILIWRAVQSLASTPIKESTYFYSTRLVTRYNKQSTELSNYKTVSKQ